MKPILTEYDKDEEEFVEKLPKDENKAMKKALDEYHGNEKKSDKEVKARANVRVIVASGSDWWESKSPAEKQEWIKKHPKSKYAKDANKTSDKRKVRRTKHQKKLFDGKHNVREDFENELNKMQTRAKRYRRQLRRAENVEGFDTTHLERKVKHVRSDIMKLKRVMRRLHIASVKEKEVIAGKFKKPFSVDVWEERDRFSIVVKDANDKDVWEAWDDDARELIEDGYINSRDIEGSTLEYLESIGVI